MRTVGYLSILAILPLSITSVALAQSPPPPTGFGPAPAVAPVPAPVPAPATAVAPAYPATPGAAAPPAAAQPGVSPSAQPGVQPGPVTTAPAQPGVVTPGPAQPGAAGNTTIAAQTSGSSEMLFGTDPNAGATAGAAAEAAPIDEDAWNREYRESSLTLGNSISGSVGLLHMQTPMSGTPGTFRTSFLSGYYSGSGFLCKDRASCAYASTTNAATQDEASTISSDIAISATLASYLEAYAGMHSMASSNSFGKPQLLQVVGDTNFGAKLFTPAKANRVFAFGGSLDLWLLNGSGSLGISNADFTIRTMASIDLTRRADAKERVPLRFHGTLGYLFDGSGSLIKDVETQRRGARVSRIERFGLDINRVDSFLIGLGAEYVHKVVQPFFEWTFDVPTNYRQSYLCSAPNNGRAAGDDCLAKASGFASTPSRLTIGTRITPGIRGLQGLLAFDIGTGATSTFIEEVAPELPWRLFVGIGFAHDITGSVGDSSATPRTVERIVQLPPPPEYRVVGLVLDDKTQQPIPNAVVKFQAQALTGMVSRADGSFETTNLQPGTYSFAITAEGYREGACSVNVLAASAQAPVSAPIGSGMAPPPAVPSDAAPYSVGLAPAASSPPVAPTSGPIVTNVACSLKAMPAVGAIQGALVDGETNMAIPDAQLTIRDAKGRELKLNADGNGAFRFENVPIGAVKISVDAQGYMPASIELEIKPRAEQRPTVSLNKRPKKANVVVTATEVKITKQIHFGNDSAVIATDSMGLLQEIALTLKEHPALARIEIQGHTDNSGAPAYNKRLSQERAEAVRNALTALGIESARLTALGYGQDKALVPNSSEENKAKNRRVQFIIKEKH